MSRSDGRWKLLALVAILAMVATACGGGDDSEAAAEGDAAVEQSAAGEDAGAESGGDGEYVLGVSNTLVGNGWREEMICSIKAEALARGNVSRVIVANRNGGPTEQIADLENLISQGVDAIIVNPSDREALNPVIEAAAEQGIVTVAVDQAVSAESAYVATNDQVAYGRIGAEWLFEQIGGEGTVVEARGVDGVPADEDRHQGFTEALENYPDIEVIEIFTDFDFSTAGQAALDLINSRDLDGWWTSGQDYTVVNAFETTGTPYIPVVGADTNEFLNQMISLQDEGFVGAAVTNPATIGGVGASIALDVLEGEEVERETLLTPELWTMDDDAETIEANYFPDRDATFSTQVTVEPYTSYEPQQLFDCQGPGE